MAYSFLPLLLKMCSDEEEEEEEEGEEEVEEEEEEEEGEDIPDTKRNEVKKVELSVEKIQNETEIHADSEVKLDSASLEKIPIPTEVKSDSGAEVLAVGDKIDDKTEYSANVPQGMGDIDSVPVVSEAMAEEGAENEAPGEDPLKEGTGEITEPTEENMEDIERGTDGEKSAEEDGALGRVQEEASPEEESGEVNQEESVSASQGNESENDAVHDEDWEFEDAQDEESSKVGTESKEISDARGSQPVVEDLTVSSHVEDSAIDVKSDIPSQKDTTDIDQPSEVVGGDEGEMNTNNNSVEDADHSEVKAEDISVNVQSKESDDSSGEDLFGPPESSEESESKDDQDENEEPGIMYILCLVFHFLFCQNKLFFDMRYTVISLGQSLAYSDISLLMNELCMFKWLIRCSCL